jgi:hypothetical protein
MRLVSSPFVPKCLSPKCTGAFGPRFPRCLITRTRPTVVDYGTDEKTEVDHGYPVLDEVLPLFIDLRFDKFVGLRFKHDADVLTTTTWGPSANEKCIYNAHGHKEQRVSDD